MKKIKVVFLGSRPLGYFALEQLKSIKGIEIVGAVVKPPSVKSWWKEDPFYLNDSNVISHQDLQRIDFDFGISINYWKIIEPSIISKPRMGFVNIHHSYMLSLRGRDMTTHALLNARQNNRWYHGTTFHYTDDGLDTGPIIATESCRITEYDTAWTLFNKVESLARRVLKIWIPRTLESNPPISMPQAQQPLNLRSDISAKHISDIFSDPLRSYDVVRAYDFNGFFEPASTMIGKNLVYLTTNSALGNKVLLSIDKKRNIYNYKYR